MTEFWQCNLERFNKQKEDWKTTPQDVIDVDIRPLINAINSVESLATQYCCSGHPRTTDRFNYYGSVVVLIKDLDGLMKVLKFYSALYEDQSNFSFDNYPGFNRCFMRFKPREFLYETPEDWYKHLNSLGEAIFK